MNSHAFTVRSAIVWGGLVAAVLDLTAVFAFWAAYGRSPVVILQSIATSRLGAPAFDGGVAAALIGLTLHFSVSFVFAGAYVTASSVIPLLRKRPLVFGVLYGLLAYVIMTFIVVPTSKATFGGWPPPLLNFTVSLVIHLFLFGVPIALAASRVDSKHVHQPVQSEKFTLRPKKAIIFAGLAAGCIEIAAMFLVWASRGRTPVDILQSIASSVLGPAAFGGGSGTAALGLALHFFVSFVFAASYILVSLRVNVLRNDPVIFGLLYGLVAHWIMSAIVVPLSLAEFGNALPSAASYAQTLIVHMFMFGLPIGIVASRVRFDV